MKVFVAVWAITIASILTLSLLWVVLIVTLDSLNLKNRFKRWLLAKLKIKEGDINER